MRTAGATWIGWSAVLLTLGFAVGLTLAHEGALLTIGFAPFCLALGVVLFRKYPRQYVFYSFSLWMFTPLVRRLADWQSSYHAASFIMLAPLLVSGLSGVTVFRRAGRLGSPALLPFTTILVLLGLAFLMGLAQNGAASAALGLLNWGAPILFAMHLLLRHRSAEEFEGALFDAMAWGVLGIGLYGLFQYFVAPQWDAFWMLQSGMTSIGTPVPRKIRLFSTMNSPGPMAAMLVVGLLALLARGGTMRWVASGPGFVALLLSLGRAAWGGFLLGALVLISTSPPKRAFQYLAIGCVVIGLATPLLFFEPVSSVVLQRVNTLNAADQDVSLRARLELYRNSTSAAQSMLGSGLGASGAATRMAQDQATYDQNSVIDSGLVELLMNFGLPGTAIFLVAVIVILSRAGLRARRHPSAGLAFSAATATFAQIAFGPIMSGVVGVVLYSLLALAISPRVRAPAKANVGSRIRGRRQVPIRA